MKRILALLLTLAMVFSLAACGLLGGKGGLSDAVAGKGEQGDIGGSGDRDEQKEPEDKIPSGGKSSVVSVVHPDFGLKDGFIEKVDQLKDAPDGFIPISTPEEFCKIDRNPAASYILTLLFPRGSLRDSVLRYCSPMSLRGESFPRDRRRLYHRQPP